MFGWRRLVFFLTLAVLISVASFFVKTERPAPPPRPPQLSAPVLPPPAPFEEEAALPPPPPPPSESPAPQAPAAPASPLEALVAAPPPEALAPAPLPAPPVTLVAPPSSFSGRGEAAWRRFALKAPRTDGRPMIAVIIDDMGVDRKRSERIFDLQGPLTVSLMSYAEDLPGLAAKARSKGFEVMMHIPMEPMADRVDPGPDALLVGLPAEEIRRRFDQDLGRLPGIVGVNNHMGSKFTADPAGMSVVMEELRRRGLLFVDSLTTARSVGLELARRYGVPSAGRNVFLDNAGDLLSVDTQLSEVEAVARKKGNAIAIGHPRDATIDALAAWLPGLAAKGFVLVPVSAVVRARLAGH